MGAREIYEAYWFFFCVFLTSNIVSHKIEKNYEYSMCFKILWCYVGIWAIQGGNVIN